MTPDNKGRASLISVITTPLGFFALSLLIVEGFLGIILIGSTGDKGLTGDQKFVGLWIGAGLFVLIVLIVTILVWKKPQHLTFSQDAHIKHDEMFGSKENPTTSEKQIAKLEVVPDSQTKKGRRQR